MRSIIWLGTTLDDVKAFPAKARQAAGYQLSKVQDGQEPTDWKPLKTVGNGVKEIRLSEAGGAFRVVYIVVKGRSIYVLHAFPKKTQKTSQRDINLAKQRYREVPT